MDWVYAFSGLLVGLAVGFTGVGGGSLMTPLLVLIFNVSPVIAVGTDLLYASITKMAGAFVHQKCGTVDWKAVGLLSAGSLPTTLLIALLLKHLSLDERVMGNLVSSVLSAALLLTAAVLLFKDSIRKALLSRNSNAHESHHRHLAAATIATGAVAGALVTVSSIGAGVLGTVSLLFLYPRMSTAKVVGTDIAHAVPLTAIAGMCHLALGTVDLKLLANLLIGSLPGICIGSHLSSKVPEKALRPLLAVMLALIGGKMIIS